MKNKYHKCDKAPLGLVKDGESLKGDIKRLIPKHIQGYNFTKKDVKEFFRLLDQVKEALKPSCKWDTDNEL